METSVPRATSVPSKASNIGTEETQRISVKQIVAKTNRFKRRSLSTSPRAGLPVRGGRLADTDRKIDSECLARLTALQRSLDVLLTRSHPQKRLDLGDNVDMWLDEFEKRLEAEKLPISEWAASAVACLSSDVLSLVPRRNLKDWQTLKASLRDALGGGNHPVVRTGWNYLSATLRTYDDMDTAFASLSAAARLYVDAMLAQTPPLSSSDFASKLADMLIVPALLEKMPPGSSPQCLTDPFTHKSASDVFKECKAIESLQRRTPRRKRHRSD